MKRLIIRVLAIVLVAELAFAVFLAVDHFGGEPNDAASAPGPVLTEADRIEATVDAGAADQTLGLAADEPDPAPETMVRLINDLRVETGLLPVYVEPVLSTAASEYCGEIAPLQWRDHVGPDGRDWTQRALDAGYTGADLVENLAWGYATAERAFAAWIDKRPDRANILNTRITGIGVAHCAVDSGDYRDWWVYIAGVGTDE
ncbi:MAG: CAP domain-containing protein [Dehalococcoidia bacterium]